MTNYLLNRYKVKMQHRTLIKVLAIACLSFFFTMQSYAQTRVLKRPPQYVYPDEQVDILAHKSNDAGKLWIVFPMNQGTTTSSSAGGSDTKSTLDFMDAFYVINEQGAHLELAKGDLQGFNLGNVESYGWVHRSKVLLWSECYASVNKITKKVLLLNNTDQISSSNQLTKSQSTSIEFYNNSDLTGESIGDYNVFNILYLFRKEGDKYLVGKKDKMEAQGIDAAKNVILGWVDKSRVTPWDSRVAIEPSWNPLGAKERREKDIPLQIFDQKQSTDAYQNGQNVDQSHVFITLTDQYEERKLGDIWRYPIIDEYENGICKVGAMGRISNEAGFVDEETNARARRKFNKGMDHKKKINIVFVIDGTWGMRPFYEPIANGIRNATEKLKGTGTSVKFGAVFYKDKGAHKVTEVVRLSNDPEDVINFIDFYPGDFEDLDAAEAVFKGLEAGIKGTGLSTKETNYVVLIGNTQNHWREDETQVAQEDLIELINKYSCHLIAMQVENKPEEDYDEFVYQFQDIIQIAAESQYNRYKNADANRKVAAPRFGESALKVEGMDKYELSHTASLGVLVTPKSGKNLEGEVLESEIYNTIIGASTKVSELVNRLEMLAFGGGSKKGSEVEDYMPAILDFIKTSAELTQEELNSISFENFQGSKEGYVAIKPNNLKKALFEYVLFLSIKELGELNAQFEALYFSAKNENQFEQRQVLYDTWVEILQAYEGADEEALAEMTMAEINEKVFGLPNRSSILADIKLKYIKDESVIDDDKFQVYTDAIARKAKEIKKIYNDPYYKTSFTNNGIRYFWLPEGLLP